MKKLALTTVLVLATACGSSSGSSVPTLSSEDNGGAFQLGFDWRQEAGPYRSQPVVTAAGGAREIVVDAHLSASSPCHKLTADARSNDGRTVELEVRILSDAPVCAASIGNFGYTARMRGLAPGTYTVRVRHLYPGTGWPSGTVLETPVTVR
ncbi:MAG TPA: hypothetical protein VF746_08795 [Longimicrobium sp.]|jgi:hypothetical protein